MSGSGPPSLPASPISQTPPTSPPPNTFRQINCVSDGEHVRKILDTVGTLKPGDKWFIVASKWWDRWKVCNLCNTFLFAYLHSLFVFPLATVVCELRQRP